MIAVIDAASVRLLSSHGHAKQRGLHGRKWRSAELRSQSHRLRRARRSSAQPAHLPDGLEHRFREAARTVGRAHGLLFCLEIGEEMAIQVREAIRAEMKSTGRT